MRETLILAAAALVLPLVLLSLRTVFVWRYRRMLQVEMGRSAGRPAGVAPPSGAQTAPVRAPLMISRVAAGASRLSGEARALADEARAATRRMRIAFTAAAAVYAAVLSGTLAAAFLPKLPLDARLVGVVLPQACVLLILVSVLSLRPSWAAATGGVFMAIGLAVILSVTSVERAVLLIGAESWLFVLIPGIGLTLFLVRRLRPLLVGLAAVLAYLLVTTIVGFVLAASTTTFQVGQVRPWVWAMGMLNTLAGLAVVGWLLRRQSARVPVTVLVVMGALGMVIDVVWHPDAPIGVALYALPVSALNVFLVWLAFRSIVRLQDHRILTAEVLQSHIAFSFMTLYWGLFLAIGADLFSGGIRPTLAVVAGFLGYAGVVHVLLYRAWAERAGRPGRRLLLLRAFGAPRARERLIDALDDTWRRIGRIDLIAGPDLAARTIGSRMVEAFIVRRADAEFLKTDHEVSDRLARLRVDLEGDGRYPINELHCSMDTWRRAVAALASGSDVVLMDLREFTRRNHGCVFELTELVHRVPLERLVLLADGTTDAHAVEEVARSAWTALPADSPNVTASRPELRLVEPGWRRTPDADALFATLLEAVAGRP